MNHVCLKPWNEEEHKRLISQGTMHYEIKKDHVYVQRRESHQPGFGTASMREIVKISLSHGFEGRVHNQAAWSSHLFHLYMGMIPNDYDVSYIKTLFGTTGEEAIQTIPQLKDILKKGESFNSDQQDDLSTLKRILARLNNSNAKDITDSQLYENFDRLQELKDKKLSYVTYVFIERVLGILEKSGDNPRPDTSMLNSVNMELSAEGIKRWKEAIDESKSFVPFYRLEHLHSKMTQKQLERLENLFS